MPNYQFKRPETESIIKETAKELFWQWQFWSLLSFAVISGVLLAIYMIQAEFFEPGFFVIPILIVAIYIGYVQDKIRKCFWKRFADLNGWQYLEQGNPEQESGVMFKQGNRRYISNIVFGLIDGRQFRIFNYSFTVGQGKSKRTYKYTVFAFKFNGSFPHIYLNSRQNFYGFKYDIYGVSVGEAISLSSEFEKKFTLMAPRKYEIEALEIFTPDVLVNLLDNRFAHDVEFVGSEMLIFTNGRMNSFDELEKEFRRALEIEDLLDEKLDKFKFTTIGDMPYNL